MNIPAWVIILGSALIVLLGVLIMIARFYRKVDQGQALIVNRLTVIPDVYFTGAVVLPIIHRAEVMDISLQTIELERNGKDGLICHDNIRADIKVSFYLRVNPTAEDVLKVAQTVGVKRASDPTTLRDLFLARFSEALKTVGKRMDFVSLYDSRDKFKDEMLLAIGRLDGYVLQDAAIDYLEQTPLTYMDPANILDAHGIRKITEITAAQNILTNHARQDERKRIKDENVKTEETVLDLARREADARAKQGREIAAVQAREAAQTAIIVAEERQKSELARIRADEEIGVQDKNKIRQIEVAQKNLESVVGVEAERVEKAKALEALEREREVEVKRIEKDKEIETQKKAIAEIYRQRVAVDRDAAEEEERINDLRLTAEAKRQKDVVVIEAEATAQQSLIIQIKAAEASETSAKMAARERLVLADADLAVADKEASAAIRRAEGLQAEKAAAGLAEVKVKEAAAVATEKMGLAEAKVVRESLVAQAEGERVGAEAIEARGLAEAKVSREKALAEAAGTEERGLAEVRVREAEAVAIEKRGHAEAESVRLKLQAEAAGLAEKAEAMKALDGVGREHEEFRLNLDKQKEVELEAIRAQRAVQTAQAEVMAAAFKEAQIQIVGGDGAFFDKFVRAVTFGRAVDGALDSSDTMKQVFSDYLSGKASLPADVKEVLTRPAVTAEGVRDLSVAAVLANLARGAGDAATKKKLDKLLETAKGLGLADLKLD